MRSLMNTPVTKTKSGRVVKEMRTLAIFVEFSKYTQLRICLPYGGARPAKHHPGDRNQGQSIREIAPLGSVADFKTSGRLKFSKIRLSARTGGYSRFGANPASPSVPWPRVAWVLRSPPDHDPAGFAG
jgi:hypothetical protein